MSGTREIDGLLAGLLRGTYRWSAADEGVLAWLPAAAAEHGVEALLWNALAGMDAAAGVREALTPVARAAVAREVLVQQELQAVTGALADEGIAALIIKGSA